MKKHELEAVFATDAGAVPDLGPIERYLTALAEERQLPAVAVAMCTARMEEAGPALRAVLAKAADGEILSDAEARLAFRGLHLVGGARDRQAWQVVMRLLRLPAMDVEDLLGDAITETLSQVVAGVFDGDADGLFQAIADRELDEFPRKALFGAATFLTWEGRIERDRMVAFLERFHDERLAPDHDQAWVGWIEAIAMLGLRPMIPRVDSAWRDGRIPEYVIARRHFDAGLAEAESAPADIERFHRANLGYIADILVTLRSPLFDEPSDPDFQDPFDLADTDPLHPDLQERYDPFSSDQFRAEPVTNPMRHVGRNDPCPCGSGKKAKKCCLVG